MTSERTADEVFSFLVRALCPFCVRCGHPSEDCAHIFSRSYRSTRWDVDNAFGMCRACHRWAHANPGRFTAFVIGIIGQAAYDDLRARARTVSHDRDLSAIAADLRRQLREVA